MDGRDAPSRPGRKAHNCHLSRGAGGVSPFSCCRYHVRFPVVAVTHRPLRVAPSPRCRQRRQVLLAPRVGREDVLAGFVDGDRTRRVAAPLKAGSSGRVIYKRENQGSASLALERDVEM